MSAFNQFGKAILRGMTAWVAMLVIIVAVVAVLLFGHDGSDGSFVLALLLGIFFVLVGITAVSIYATLAYVSYVKAKERLWAIPGFSEERLLREAGRGPKIRNVLVCSDAICFCTECRVHTVPIREIVWVYQGQGQYGDGLEMYTMDGQVYQMPVLPCKGAGTVDSLARYLLRLVARKNKGALIGYRESYDELRRKDFNRLAMQVRGQEIVDSALLEQEYIQNNYYVMDLQ